MKLLRRQLDDFLFVLPLLELLAAGHQQFRIIGLLRRLPSLFLDAGSKGAGHDAGNQHDEEGDGIIRIGCMQSKAGNGKKVVKGHDAEQRSKSAVQMSTSPDGGDQNTEDINDNNVGVSQSQRKEPKPDQGGQSCYQKGLEKILPAEPGFITAGKE